MIGRTAASGNNHSLRIEILIAVTGHRDPDLFQYVVKSIVNRTGSAPIIGNVLEEVLSNEKLVELFPWLLDQPRSSDEPFTEDVLLAVMEKYDLKLLQWVVEAMIDRTGSAPVT